MLKSKHIAIIFLLSFLSSFLITANAQFDVPQIPEKQTSVYDEINLLSPANKHNLEQKLIRYSDSTSTQIVVAIISTTNNDDISLVGAKWLHEWGIGQADEDNGILILLAKDDREIDINTGYGIEYRLSDIDAERIINRIMIPEFKKGNYYAGLDQGTNQMFKILNGEFVNDIQNDSNEFPFIILIFLFIIFIIFLIAISKNRHGGNHGKGGNRTNGTSILDAIILSNMGRGSYGSSSSGGFGGGFGSRSSGGFSGGFGGGSGGGGGASGSW